MISKIAQKRKNLNSSARRTRVVCFHEKEAFKNVNFGSKIELKHGPNFHNDHNVIEVYADGVFIGHVIHKKRKGDEIAKKAVKAGITKVVFDRGGYQYHGRVQALADAAREKGLEF